MERMKTDGDSVKKQVARGFSSVKTDGKKANHAFLSKQDKVLETAMHLIGWWASYFQAVQKCKAKPGP